MLIRSVGKLSKVLVLMATLGAMLAAAASAEKPETGRYIVVFEDSVGAPANLAKTQTENRDADLGYVYRHALKGYSAQLTNAEVKGLRNDPRVDFVSRDHPLKLFSQTTPTGIKRIFATSSETLDIDEEDDLRADVDVAVIDTGIAEHEDLNIAGRTDCATEKEGSFKCVDGVGGDYQGHGTHVAGTIGAIDNGKGVVGIAPGARLWSVRVYLFTPIETFESSAVAGVDWVTAHSDEIEVANMSFGCTELVEPKCPSGLPALDDAISEGTEQGVVFVAAAGNEGIDAKYAHPASHPDVIGVSAMEDFDGLPGKGKDPLAEFSNYGSVVDAVAPGVSILSTVPGNEYVTASGTSMAAPHVAGVAALLAQYFEPGNAADVEAIREKIAEEGNLDWYDWREDGDHEPLLDVSTEELFALGPKPIVSMPAATKLSATDVTLSALVNPNGLETDVRFQYGKTNAYGSEVIVSPEIGSGTSFVEVEEELESLKPGTTYHYRVWAENEKGVSLSPDRTFTTLAPNATTKAATELTGGKATLNGTVNPNGLETNYQFEYGTTTSYGSKAPVSPKGIGSGTTDVNVSEAISGLKAETTYHFRVVAQTGEKVVYGKDETFTTPKPKWSLQEMDELSAEEEYGMKVISCSSAEACMAVGSSNEGEFLIEHWDGEEWSSEFFSPPAGGVIEGISCPSATDCTVLGAVGSQLFVERWDGAEWSLEWLPGELGWTTLASDIACATAESCVVAGLYSGEDTVTAHWDGSKWTARVMPQPSEVSGLVYSYEVSCSAANACTAAGHYADGFYGTLPYAARWDGSKWSLQSVPSPGGTEEMQETLIGGVSCPTSGACTAVGAFWVPQSEEVNSHHALFAARWDGSKWALQSMPEPGGWEGWDPIVGGVSCATSEACMAVGTANTGSSWGPAAARWDGSKWTVEQMPVPEVPLSAAGIADVSCASAQLCTAVGTVGGYEYTSRPFAEVWE